MSCRRWKSLGSRRRRSCRVRRSFAKSAATSPVCAKSACAFFIAHLAGFGGTAIREALGAQPEIGREPDPPHGHPGGNGCAGVLRPARGVLNRAAYGSQEECSSSNKDATCDRLSYGVTFRSASSRVSNTRAETLRRSSSLPSFMRRKPLLVKRETFR